MNKISNIWKGIPKEEVEEVKFSASTMILIKVNRVPLYLPRYSYLINPTSYFLVIIIALIITDDDPTPALCC